MDHEFLNQTQPPIIAESSLRHSAVTIALTENNEVVFEIRSEKIGHQPGDICLPGGGLEDGETPEQAAVREMSEELLVDLSQIELLGPVCIFVTGMLEIHCFLGRIHGYVDTCNESEVARILRVPVSFFLENRPDIYEIDWKPDLSGDFPFDKIYGGRNYIWRAQRRQIRFYEYEGNVIWGITARIMEAFAERCREKR